MSQDKLFASLLRPHAEALLVKDVMPKVHALSGSLSDSVASVIRLYGIIIVSERCVAT